MNCIQISFLTLYVNFFLLLFGLLILFFRFWLFVLSTGFFWFRIDLNYWNIFFIFIFLVKVWRLILLIADGWIRINGVRWHRHMSNWVVRALSNWIDRTMSYKLAKIVVYLRNRWQWDLPV